MELNNMNEVTIGTYVKAWWQNLPWARKKRGWLFLAFFVAGWLAGAVYAPTAVAGIAGAEGFERLFFSLLFGGFAFLWSLLKAAGLIQETTDQPHLLWVPLMFLMPVATGLFFYILSRPPNPLYAMRKMMEKGSRSQGRVAIEDVKETMAIEAGIPLTQISEEPASARKEAGKTARKKTLIGLDYQRAEGHVLVVAPTRAGKGLHLTDTLRHYPGPALIVDPKGEQLKRTAALRSQLGPIYRIPGHQVHLSAYYQHLRDRDETTELHYHLLRPWASAEPIFAEKALSLFNAIGCYAQALRLNPIRLLIDLAESHPVIALTALRLVEAARRHVDIFTNGAEPGAYLEDRFVTSALGNFTTRLSPYQKHIDTIAPPDLRRRDLIIPPEWASQNATIYVTYSLNELRGVGGVVAAIIAGILRHQMRAQQEMGQEKQKMLVAIDELPAVGLHNIVDYLSTCGGYGITMLLYVQSVAQLQALYGRDGLRAILSNCVHQLWYPAAEMETARFMSELYGTTWKANPMQSASRSARQQQDKEGKAQMQTSSNQGASWSWREAAAVSANEMMSLPQGQVLATTRAATPLPVGGAAGWRVSKAAQPPALADRQVVFLGERLNSIHLFDQLPPPDSLHLPSPVYRTRQYTDWAALGVRLERQPEPQPAPPAPPSGSAARETQEPTQPATGGDAKKSDLSDAARLMG